MALVMLLSVLIMVGAGCSLITQPFVTPVVSIPPEVNATRLEEHVRFLSETVHPRSYRDTENINAAADYISAYFESLGFIVEEQQFDVSGHTYRNIVTRLGPQEGELLIIGAHYDSAGNTPGADDNASGVAGLLELAALWKDNPPNRPVELVAYTLEEPPFFSTRQMGSAIHAQALKASERKVELMISLEMIGYFSDEERSQNYPVGFLKWLYPTQGNFIGVIGRFSDIADTRKVKALMSGATDLPVYSINSPRILPGLDFSDHRNYWDASMNAVMITDTAFLRNTHYHQLTDTTDRLDYDRMAKVVQGVYAVVRGL